MSQTSLRDALIEYEFPDWDSVPQELKSEVVKAEENEKRLKAALILNALWRRVAKKLGSEAVEECFNDLDELLKTGEIDFEKFATVLEVDIVSLKAQMEKKHHG